MVAKATERGRIDLVGISEIAVMAKVSPSAVTNWRKRSQRLNRNSAVLDPFPKPIADLASGPVFKKLEVIAWLERNSKIGVR